MIILGIETATTQVGCAIGGVEGVLASFNANRGRRHAETLAPAIEFVCKQARVELQEISAVAVDIGPGLFTGLRVGIATAKAMAQALRVPMIGLSSLDLLAFPVRYSNRLIVPVIDARRGEVFTAFYRQVPGGVQRAVAVRGDDAGRPRVRAAWRGRGPPAGRRRCLRYAVDVQRRRRRRARHGRQRLSRRRPPWSSWPTRGPSARSSCSRGSSSRSTCASPTPRSTGTRGSRRSHGARRVSRSRVRRRRPRGRASCRCAGATCARCCASRRRCIPGPWSLSLFVSELALRTSRAYFVARVDGVAGRATPG